MDSKYWVLILIIFLIISTACIILKTKTAEIYKLNERIEKLLAERDPEKLMSHQRDVWLAVLEWCESNGITTAINPKDLDGTASFGAFQFKPSTFRGYQEKYGIQGELMDYDAQLEILKRMLDDKDVKWEKEFPACIKKIGKPPAKP